MSTVVADKPASMAAPPVVEGTASGPSPISQQARSRGWMLALFATLCFSVAAPVARAAILAGFDATSLLAARMVLATFLLAATIAAVNPARLKIDGPGLRMASLVGLLNGLGMLCFFWALNFVEASLVSMIISLSPLFVLSLLALRGERVTYRHGVRLVLALSGVYLLIGPSGQIGSPLGAGGFGLAFFAVMLFSLQMALVQWYLPAYDSRTVVLYVTGSMTLVVLAGWWFMGAHWEMPGWGGWLAVVVLAVVSTFLSRLAYFAAVAILGSGQLAMLGPLETLLTIVWSTLFLHEQLTWLQMVGGVLILLSAALAIQRLGRARQRPRWRLRPRP